MTTTRTSALRIEVTPEAEHEADLARATRQILTDPEVNREFPGGDLWMVSYDFDTKADEGQGQFMATVADMASGRMMEVRGDLLTPENWWMRHLGAQRPPTEDEFRWAVGVLTDHHDLEATGETPYRPVPPLGRHCGPDGGSERVVAVGLRSPQGKHRIVGLRVIDGVVEHEVDGIPPLGDEWGLTAGPPAPATKGANQARVKVWAGNDVARQAGTNDTATEAPPTWELVVVRPSASSGLNGSGVELREVDFAGRRVLHRAHLPIVTADLGGELPMYRTWLHAESGFEATGEEAVPGFRTCDSPPTTLGGGTFRGVALYADGDDLVITSEMEAGWYRYITEWRLSAQGVIRPRFTVAATTNPLPTGAQSHHAYWRFDFDIDGPGENLAQEFNDPAIVGEANWHMVTHEVRRSRSAEHGRHWRIRNIRSSATYSVIPGPGDGESADGDFWVLRFHEEETDDGQGFTTDRALARAQLDRLLNGEPVRREDVVVWYAAHATLDPPAGPVAASVGPDLVPAHWVRVASDDVFGHVDNTDSYRP